MKNIAEPQKIRFPLVPLLLMFCLFAVHIVAGRAEAQFRDLVNSDDNPNPNSPFKEIPCEGINCDYADDDEPEFLDEIDDDPPQEEQVTEGSPGPAGSATSSDGLRRLPGYGDCLVTEGSCFILPDSSEENDDEGSGHAPGSQRQDFPESTPDQGRTTSPFGSPGNSRGASRVASPFATPGSGGFGSGANSPFSNPAGSSGSTAISNGRAEGSNATTADCNRAMSAASSSFSSCANPHTQQGICNIARNLANCGDRLLQQMQNSSCRESVKRTNIEGIRSWLNRARATASQSCAN